ncbi:uncharacterized protein A1O5_08338, partial [Cladophialophora psammophila CBS 110553]
SLLWSHGCYDVWQSRCELQRVVDPENGIIRLRDVDPRWVALLFASLAGNIASANKSDFDSQAIEEVEAAKLQVMWYKASVVFPNVGQFTVNHDVKSIQTIGILIMSAHTVGFSREFHALLGAALRIAFPRAHTRGLRDL